MVDQFADGHPQDIPIHDRDASQIPVIQDALNVFVNGGEIGMRISDEPACIILDGLRRVLIRNKAVELIQKVLLERIQLAKRLHGKNSSLATVSHRCDLLAVEL